MKLWKGEEMKEYIVTMLVIADEDTVKNEYGDNVEDMVRWSMPDDVEFGYNVLGSEEVMSEDERWADMEKGEIY
ncbi:hypothetical protein [uncultured Acetatifactor sp.]|jgi:hypothetical protein|uniref:hypothetical protein n=2 Tax=uncultured Acetatifactor sp. TaxID=1671927 RepID=UPI00262BAE66|nr:hypothetical protein [uncultured Acetatifactor sp.]